jgi:hypothetical protein
MGTRTPEGLQYCHPPPATLRILTDTYRCTARFIQFDQLLSARVIPAMHSSS